jgi:hypothetical protein
MPTPEATYDTRINITPAAVPSDTQTRIGSGINDDFVDVITIPSKERCYLRYDFPAELNYTYAGQTFALYIYSDPRKINEADISPINGLVVTVGADPDIELDYIDFRVDMDDLESGATYYCVMRQTNAALLAPPRTIVWRSFILHVDRFG